MKNVNIESSMRDDLVFLPVKESQCRKLSADQARAFNRDGYLSALPIFTADEAIANRNYFDELLARVLASGRDSYSINSYQTKCAGIYDICNDIRIKLIVQDILGPNFVCWSSHFFCKLPGDINRIPWHQDAPHWPLTPSKTVTAWLAIDDADEANGCMRVLPGSHLHGVHPYRYYEDEGSSILHHCVDDDATEGAFVLLGCAAGEISIHSDLLLHSSGPNHSSRRRCGLAIRYAATDVIADKRWSFNSILCMGQDPLGRWRHIRRPRGEDLTPWLRPWNAKIKDEDPQ